MVCPDCENYIMKSQELRKNVKAFENVDITYDVVCPFCGALVGQMFWGRLLPPGADVTTDPPPMPLSRLKTLQSRKNQESGLDETAAHAEQPVEESGLKADEAYRKNDISGILQPRPAGPTSEEQGPQDKRQGERRKQKKSVLYDRRLGGHDRRSPSGRLYIGKATKRI